MSVYNQQRASLASSQYSLVSSKEYTKNKNYPLLCNSKLGRQYSSNGYKGEDMHSRKTKIASYSTVKLKELNLARQLDESITLSKKQSNNLHNAQSYLYGTAP